MVNFRGLTSVQGGTIPAELWHNYMAAALASEPQLEGTFPLVYTFGGQTLTPPEVGSTVLFPEGLGTTTTTAPPTTTTIPSATTVPSTGPRSVHSDHGACADDRSAAHHRPATRRVCRPPPRPPHGRRMALVESGPAGGPPGGRPLTPAAPAPRRPSRPAAVPPAAVPQPRRRRPTPLTRPTPLFAGFLSYSGSFPAKGARPAEPPDVTARAGTTNI